MAGITKHQVLNKVSANFILHGKEVEQFHTRLLRTSLALEESRVYWEHSRINIPKGKKSSGGV